MPSKPTALALSCPGNLLLGGEYLVMEQGGKGLALGCEPRAWLWAWTGGLDHPFPPTPDRSGLTISRLLSDAPPVPLWQGSVDARGNWTPVEGSPDFPLWHSVLSTWKPATLPLLGMGSQWQILIDTTAFHRLDGRKYGLGSSACTCLLLCAFLALASQSDTPGWNGTDLYFPDNREIPRHGVRAHRHFQGGRGSGYDIWTSYLGGPVLFTGGPVPAAIRLRQPLALSQGACLVCGPQAVSSAEAARRWQVWRESHPKQLAGWLQRQRANLGELLSTQRSRTSERTMGTWLKKSAELGLEIGAALGIEARTYISKGFSKSLGAGNETILWLPGPRRPADGPEQFLPVQAAPGLCCHRVSRGQAHGKLLLFGEHTIFHGSAAAGLPVPLGLEILAAVGLKPSASAALPRPPDTQGGGAEPKSATGQWFYSPITPVTQSLVRLEPVLNSLVEQKILPRQTSAPLTLVCRGDLPPGAGLGSSAAFSIALLRALGCKEALLQQGAVQLETVFHGKSSGIDTALAAVAHPLVFQAGFPDSHPTQTALLRPRAKGSVWLVCAALARSDDCVSLVARISRMLTQPDPGTKDILASLNLLWQDWSTSLGSQSEASAGQWAQWARAGQQHLVALGLGNAESGTYLALGLARQNLGGKLSGAGAGGGFFAICQSREEAKDLARLWTAHSSQLPPNHPGVLLFPPLVINALDPLATPQSYQ